MADFVVEDGTGVIGAESYNTVEEFRAYVERMAYEQDAVTTATDVRIQAHMRRAAVFMDGFYGIRAGGEKRNPAQGLMFPRINLFYLNGDPVDSDSVPGIYKAAHIEATIFSLQGTALAATVQAGPRLKRDKTDVLEEEYFENTHDSAPVFGWLDTILAALFAPIADIEEIRIAGLSRA